uniref:Uncharacterized protein n=1 Tax=Arundo donax TaxID=35708 RepID=A0A0A9EAH5_ARUDO
MFQGRYSKTNLGAIEFILSITAAAAGSKRKTSFVVHQKVKTSKI